MRASRSPAFSLGLLVVSGLGLAWALGRAGVAPPLPGARLPEWLGGAGQPVLVVVLEQPGGVAGVRDAVAAERIVAESPAAFAVRERRLVAGSFEAVGPLLAAAGWQDAPLEIIALRRGAVAPAFAPDPVDRVFRLMSKPRLSLLEARAVLEVM